MGALSFRLFRISIFGWEGWLIQGGPFNINGWMSVCLSECLISWAFWGFSLSFLSFRLFWISILRWEGWLIHGGSFNINGYMSVCLSECFRWAFASLSMYVLDKQERAANPPWWFLTQDFCTDPMIMSPLFVRSRSPNVPFFTITKSGPLSKSLRGLSPGPLNFGNTAYSTLETLGRIVGDLELLDPPTLEVCPIDWSYRS